MIFEVMHQLGLLPLAMLAALQLAGRRYDPVYWWLGIAFGVSWLADTAAHWISPPLVSVVYPVSQASIVVAVLLPRAHAAFVLAIVVLVAIGVVVFRGVDSPEALIRATAWGAIIAALLPASTLGFLRTILLFYYGLGLLAWLGYVAAPGWVAWGIYQGTRVLGIGGFCAQSLRRKL